MMRTVIPLFGLLILGTFATVYVHVPTGGEQQANAVHILAAPETRDPLFEREIIEHAFLADDVVAYQYLGEKLPEKLTADEDPSLRTEYSFTRVLGFEGEGEGRVQKREARTFPQKVFHKNLQGEWFYVEHGTSSLQVWNERPISLIDAVRKVLLPFAYADTVYGLSGDGDVSRFSNGSDNIFSVCRANVWSDAQASFSGTASNGGQTLGVASEISSEANEFPPPTFLCTANISRSFLPFQTDFIPTRGHITAATLNLYIESVTNSGNDGSDFLSVWETSQAAHTTLVNADYDNFLSEVIDSAERKDLSSVSVSQYLSIALNGTGLQAIKKQGEAASCSSQAGVTCLGVREGHDALASEPLDSNAATFYSSERSGVSQDPYLSITYTVPDTLGIKGGRLDVKGGTIRIQ